LVWSNPQADDSAYIYAALLKPHFAIILDLCAEFGLERVEAEWQSLLQEGEMAKVNRAKPLVERMLHNIRKEFEERRVRKEFYRTIRVGQLESVVHVLELSRRCLQGLVNRAVAPLCILFGCSSVSLSQPMRRNKKLATAFAIRGMRVTLSFP
jgi:hypothetical protein